MELEALGCSLSCLTHLLVTSEPSLPCLLSWFPIVPGGQRGSSRYRGSFPEWSVLCSQKGCVAGSGLRRLHYTPQGHLSPTALGLPLLAPPARAFCHTLDTVSTALSGGAPRTNMQAPFWPGPWTAKHSPETTRPHQPSHTLPTAPVVAPCPSALPLGPAATALGLPPW